MSHPNQDESSQAASDFVDKRASGTYRKRHRNFSVVLDSIDIPPHLLAIGGDTRRSDAARNPRFSYALAQLEPASLPQGSNGNALHMEPIRFDRKENEVAQNLNHPDAIAHLKKNDRQLSYSSAYEHGSPVSFCKRSTTSSDSSALFHSTQDSPTKDGQFWSNSDPFGNKRQSLSQVSSGHSKKSSVSRPKSVYLPPGERPRRGTFGSVFHSVMPDALARKVTNGTIISLKRRDTLIAVYEKAKERGAKLQRKKWVQVVFEYSIYITLLCFIYFVLVGRPLWDGTISWIYWVVKFKLAFAGGWSIVFGVAFVYAFAPLCTFFEQTPRPSDGSTETNAPGGVQDTALLIPCYKSADLLPATLVAALKIFSSSQIFVLNNGNSEVPIDGTEEVCDQYRVNHLWCPIGSKIVAQFVGCYAAKSFQNVLLIDDDCSLPENFPVVSERLEEGVKCIGYTIKSVGPDHANGNLCQQAQDLEYKMGGIQRVFAGKIGSATFPHGAISLWDRQFLLETFKEHPGFNISEDWFFGHAARRLGSRIKMCSQVFVETETPSAVFFSRSGSRGGFGEMTVFKQRFTRWNFFFVNGMFYNAWYILGSWKLGFWEIGTKIFVFQEIYETLLYLLTPFFLPISFVVRPEFSGILLAATTGLYLANAIIFNEVHLRRKKERLGWVLIYVYYIPYKWALLGINVASCYWSMYKYARYFAKRHLKIVEDEKAMGIVMRLEEEEPVVPNRAGRRMTVHTVRTGSILEYIQPQTTSSTTHNEGQGIVAIDYAMPRSNQVEHQQDRQNDQ